MTLERFRSRICDAWQRRVKLEWLIRSLQPMLLLILMLLLLVVVAREGMMGG